MTENRFGLDMLSALDSRDSSIKVQNGESDFSRFYHMDVPFQLTLEYCNGPDPKDYVNIVTLSATKAVMYQESLLQKNNSYTKNAPHFHDFFEFVFVLEGNIIQKIEGKEYHYTAGSCCLINRNLRHMEYYHEKSRVLFIGLSPDMITELFDSAQNPLFPNEKEIYDSRLYHSGISEPSSCRTSPYRGRKDDPHASSSGIWRLASDQRIVMYVFILSVTAEVLPLHQCPP